MSDHHQADAYDAAQTLERNDCDDSRLTPPRIGEVWIGQGGVYAGLARGRDGAPDYHLIVGPEHDGAASWGHVDEWARNLNIEGHTDFRVMQRADGWICQANVPELFAKSWYWLEAHASSSLSAWSQYFDYGNQYIWSKDGKLRARAVRRLAIQ